MFETYFGKKKLVCFDFDGLLVNTEPLHHKAYNMLLTALKAPLDLNFSDYCSIAHDQNRSLFEQTVRRTYPGFSHEWEDVRDQKTALYRKLLQSDHVPAMEGASELITKLRDRDIDICIVTNSDRCDVDTIRKHLPIIESIPLVIAREDYDLPKPAPDGYLKALKLHGVEAKDAIGLEDTHKGITALQNAGMDHLFINKSNTESKYRTLRSFL